MAPSAETRRKRFRSLLGLANDETVFDDEEVNDYYTEAEEEYGTDAPEKALKFEAVAQACLFLRANASKRASYTHATGGESLGQVATNLKVLYDDFIKQRNEALDNSNNLPLVGWGDISIDAARKPSRTEEYPDA